MTPRERNVLDRHSTSFHFSLKISGENILNLCFFFNKI